MNLEAAVVNVWRLLDWSLELYSEKAESLWVYRLTWELRPPPVIDIADMKSWETEVTI